MNTETALNPTHYWLATTTATFPTDGTDTLTFPVTIIDDTDPDSDKTFRLTLDSVTGEGAVLGTQTEIVITILENGRQGAALNSAFCTMEIVNKK